MKKFLPFCFLLLFSSCFSKYHLSSERKGKIDDNKKEISYFVQYKEFGDFFDAAFNEAGWKTISIPMKDASKYYNIEHRENTYDLATSYKPEMFETRYVCGYSFHFWNGIATGSHITIYDLEEDKIRLDVQAHDIEVQKFLEYFLKKLDKL